MKPFLLQCILQYTLLKYFTLQFLGHKAPSTSIYPTILFKILKPPILGHEAISTSIYPTIQFIKIFNPPIPGA